MAFPPVSPLKLDGLPKFLSLMYHRVVANSIYTFAELELADRMSEADPEQGLTIDEILGQDRSKWNKGMLLRIFRCCADADVIRTINDDHFVLTESGKMLTSKHPTHASDFVRTYLSPFLNQGVTHLVALIRGEIEGTVYDPLTGNLDFYTFLHLPEQKSLLKMFNGTMTTQSLQAGDLLVTNVSFDRFSTLVDIGGNRGTYMAQILQHYPSIQHGVVFDQAAIVDTVDKDEEFRIRGVSKDRYHFVGGNVFDSSTIPHGDAYLIKNVFYNHDSEKVKSILSGLAKTKDEQRKVPLTIFIVEVVHLRGESISNWQTHAIDVLTSSTFRNAQVRTLEEHTALLEQTGFQVKQFYPIEAPSSIIEAVLV
jgi:hypothetical protein